MSPVDLRKATPLALGWLAWLAGASVLLLSESLPFRLAFVRPETLFGALVQAQLFFVVLLWPISLPAGAPEAALARVAALLALSLPLLLVGANVSDAGAGILLLSQFLVAAHAAFTAGLYAFAGVRAGPWYYLGAFAASALLPLAAFLSHEFDGPDLSPLAWVSPFWGARGIAAAPGPAFGQACLFAALAVGLHLAARFLRREVDAPAPAK